jgi:predicted RNA-binding Zn ribbon-like protein
MKDADETALPLLLALLNSAPVIDGVPRDDLADADAWLTAHGWPAAPNPAAELRAARAALKAVVRGEENPVSLAPFLKDVRYHASMTGQGINWTLDDRSAQSVAVQAVLAWDALNTGSPGRLRPCANPDCELFLVDRSKANNARWCSMAVCGNRMKARRHYQRANARRHDTE